MLNLHLYLSESVLYKSVHRDKDRERKEEFRVCTIAQSKYLGSSSVVCFIAYVVKARFTILTKEFVPIIS